MNNTSDIALFRLNSMKSTDSLTKKHEQYHHKEKQAYIQNPVPIDNNKMWTDGHNILSSKGD